MVPLFSNLNACSCVVHSNTTSAHNRLEGLIVLVPFIDSLLAFKTFMHYISFFLCMLSHAVILFFHDESCFSLLCHIVLRRPMLIPFFDISKALFGAVAYC